MKPLKFIGSSEDDLAEFPREAKGWRGTSFGKSNLA